MIVISMALVLVGFVTLMLGVVGVGGRPLQFVYASIGACLLAAVFLVTGVLRARPSRRPAIADGPDQPTWSGAVRPGPDPAAQGETHVQVLSAREAAREAVAATTTGPLDLEPQGAAGGEGERQRFERERFEQERFVRALAGLELDAARFERLRGRFVTVERLTAASASELAEVPGISSALAETIHARLRSPR